MSNATNGERRSNAKLTDRDVRMMRVLYGCKWSVDVLARMYGVSHGTAYKAIVGDTWAHITTPAPHPRGARPHNWRQLAKRVV